MKKDGEGNGQDDREGDVNHILNETYIKMPRKIRYIFTELYI